MNVYGNTPLAQLLEPAVHEVSRMIVASSSVYEHQIFRRGETGSERRGEQPTCPDGCLDGGRRAELWYRLRAGAHQSGSDPSQSGSRNISAQAQVRTERDRLSVAPVRLELQNELVAPTFLPPDAEHQCEENEVPKRRGRPCGDRCLGN
jgi:hypothetical protein